MTTPPSRTTPLPPADPEAVVVSIAARPRSPQRIRIELSSGRHAVLEPAEVDHAALVEGARWSEETVRSIEYCRAFACARREALRHLARREHSRRDLADRLERRGHDSALVEMTLDQLESDGWLDEARFLEARLDEWLRRPAHGRAYLLARLEQAGVDADEARIAMDRLYSPEAERAAAVRVAASLAVGNRSTPRRIAAALQRRGFDEAIVSTIDACKPLFEAD